MLDRSLPDLAVPHTIHVRLAIGIGHRPSTFRRTQRTEGHLQGQSRLKGRIAN
jgi:hypothetical protein